MGKSTCSKTIILRSVDQDRVYDTVWSTANCLALNDVILLSFIEFDQSEVNKLCTQDTYKFSVLCVSCTK